jgi:hypothetical protein
LIAHVLTDNFIVLQPSSDMEWLDFVRVTPVRKTRAIAAAVETELTAVGKRRRRKPVVSYAETAQSGDELELCVTTAPEVEKSGSNVRPESDRFVVDVEAVSPPAHVAVTTLAELKAYVKRLGAEEGEAGCLWADDFAQAIVAEVRRHHRRHSHHYSLAPCLQLTTVTSLTCGHRT